MFSKSITITPGYHEALERVFHGAIRTSDIRPHLGGAAAIGASRTLGNHIYFHTRWKKLWHEESTEAMGLLVHEAVHVWQYHTIGWRYAGRSLWEQLIATTRHGTRREAYRYRLATDVDFLSYGIEQQAQLIQDWYLGTTHQRWESARIHCDNFAEIEGEAYLRILEGHLSVLRADNADHPTQTKQTPPVNRTE